MPDDAIAGELVEIAAQGGRLAHELKFTIPAAGTDSEIRTIEQGCWGTIIVPVGSELIGKTLQFVAVSEHDPAQFAPTVLLSAAKLLAAGANALTQDEIREVGAALSVLLRVNSATVAEASLVLLWKA